MKVGNAMAILSICDPRMAMTVLVDGKRREIETIGLSLKDNEFQVLLKDEDSGNG